MIPPAPFFPLLVGSGVFTILIMKCWHPCCIALLLVTPSLAGSFGPGPWANGAYYPGQYDGVYSAAIFGGAPSVVSGVLGFGLANGSPSTSTDSTVLTNGIQNTITVDPFENYFIIFVNGRSYGGLTIANINGQTDQVSGGLYNGTAAATVTTNLSIENTCGGAFTAAITDKKAVIAFTGDQTGILSTSTNGVPVTTETFSLNGMRVGSQVAGNSTSTSGGQ